MTLPPFVWLITWLILSAPFVYIIGRVDILTGAGQSLARRLSLGCIAVGWIGLGRVLIPFLGAGGIEPVDSAAWTLGAITMRFDGLSVLMACLVMFLMTAILLYSGQYIGREEGAEKHYALLLLLTGVIIGLASAGDLFNLWMWFEAMAITSYPLVVFYTHDRPSLEAGIKYLIQSSVGSVFILLGIALVLLATGTLDILDIRATIATTTTGTPLWMTAGVLFIIGFGIKVALVPLHTWLPDAHAQAPSGISAILSAVVIEAGFIALLRSLSALAGAAVTWGGIMIGLGLFNIILGNLMALRQRQVKRLLAFSSLAHVGYMVLGLGVALYTGTAEGAQAGFFHLLSHGLMKGLAFLAAGALLYGLRHQVGMAGGDHAVSHQGLEIDDLSGAARRYPVVAFVLSLSLMSLAGLPPLAGFMSKWQVLMAGAQAKDPAIMLVLILAALFSVVSLGYYAPLINRLYRREPAAIIANGRPIPLSMTAPLVVLAAAIVILGLMPMVADRLSSPAATDLLSLFIR